MYIIEFTADVEGNWCLNCAGRAYATREAAQAAIDADQYAKPDEYGNKCYPSIIEIDEEGYDSHGNYHYIDSKDKQDAAPSS